MRMSRDEWGLRLAEATAQRGTCLRRQVGCVLVDERGRVLSTGYNGVASGEPHCDEISPCLGAGFHSGERLDLCVATHAEQNALIQCRDTDAILTCYVTVSPCISCVKLLMNTGCLRIVFREGYAENAENLWVGTQRARTYGREWVKV